MQQELTVYIWRTPHVHNVRCGGMHCVLLHHSHGSQPWPCPNGSGSEEAKNSVPACIGKKHRVVCLMRMQARIKHGISEIFISCFVARRFLFLGNYASVLPCVANTWKSWTLGFVLHTNKFKCNASWREGLTMHRRSPQASSLIKTSSKFWDKPRVAILIRSAY